MDTQVTRQRSGTGRPSVEGYGRSGDPARTTATNPIGKRIPVNPTLQHARLDGSSRDPGKHQSEQVNPPYQARGRWQMAPINLASNRRRVTKSISGSSESGHDERPSLPAFEMVDVVR